MKKYSSSKTLFLFFSFFLFLFFFTPDIFAWTEYDCESSCSGNLLCRDCQVVCDEYNEEDVCIRSHQECSSWTVCQDCQNWEKCNLSGCSCASECLEKPTNPQPPADAQKITLPVTLSWNSANGAASYRYKIEGVLEETTTLTQTTIKNCTLKSNTNYNWRVQACCSQNGTNCSSWSDLWSFKTSLSPEPLSPQNSATSVPIPVRLDWCDVSEAQSFYIKAYRGSEIIELPVQKKEGILSSEATFGQEIFTKNSNYQWEIATCLNENLTKCGLDCAANQEGDQCGDYGQRWNFTTGETALPVPEITSPKSADGMPVVNFSSYLGWKPIGIQGVSSYRYEIKKDGEKTVDDFTTVSSVPFSSFWQNLDFNQVYSWKVKACWDERGEGCETTSSESTFKTTGQTPNIISPAANESVSIPVKLDWTDVPGTLSYKYQIFADSNFSQTVTQGTVSSSEVSISYPALNMETPYWWQVSSCADSQGNACGTPTSSNFTASKLSSPAIESPLPGAEVDLPIILSWQKMDNAQYEYWLVSEGETVEREFTSNNSSQFSDLEINKEYQWKVRVCFEPGNEESCSDWSSQESFKAVETPLRPGEGGFVPCGRKADDPRTPYNEMESCQFPHLFIMLKNILDFLLWRLGLIILALLAVATGVIYYFSMGNPKTMAKVKSLLKSAVTGYIVIFFAWMILTTILAVIGFEVEIFGRWWEIKF